MELLKSQTDSPAYPQYLTVPYTLGIYLAVNAIRDAYLVVDAPNCVFAKTEYIYKNHDIFSTILSPLGYHRVAHTQINSSEVTLPHDEKISGLVRKILDRPDSKLVLVSALPMVSITGVQYDLILDNMRDQGVPEGKDMVEVPPKSLTSDWLHGYAESLKAISRIIDLEHPSPKKDTVAIVGYLFDRNEGDHHGNIAHLKEILNGMGLNVCSVWLSGSYYETLKDVQYASHIISLPYGREAAKHLGKRLNIEVVECDYPIGIQGTKDFIHTIGNALDKQQEAKETIDRGLRYIIPKLKEIIPFHFAGKKIGLFIDPYLVRGMFHLMNELGFILDTIFIHGKEKHENKIDIEDIESQVKIQSYPSREMIQDNILSQKDNPYHIFITNSLFEFNPQDPTEGMNFGFPSYLYHAMAKEAFLGFEGVLNLSSRLIYHSKCATISVKSRPNET